MRCNPRMVWASALCAALATGFNVAARAADQPVSLSYISGGVGVDSQERLNARAGEFNLKLVFTLVEGNYLADVNVVLTDAKGGKIVEHLADGPFFLVKLPAGQYSVAATYEGKTVTRKLQVGARGLRTEYFRWPSNPETDLPVSRWLDPDTISRPRAKPAAKPRRG